MDTIGTRHPKRRLQQSPMARSDGLIVEELANELLVYDLVRHKAHCLNETSALVWKHCDGKSDVGELTQLLRANLATRVDNDVVLLALDQLRGIHLLEEDVTEPSRVRVTRRDLVLKYLPGALVLPLILSIPSPASAQAASIPCATLGQPCDPPPCCTGLTCDGICFPG